MEFKKDDLQKDDIVYFNNGTTGKVGYGEIVIVRGYLDLNLYDSDLKHKNDSIGDWHIVKVDRPELKEVYRRS